MLPSGVNIGTGGRGPCVQRRRGPRVSLLQPDGGESASGRHVFGLARLQLSAGSDGGAPEQYTLTVDTSR
jgi:hypothetical protein